MKLCPYCHLWTSENDFNNHVSEHVRLRPDGQMRDHVTLRPEERFAGDISREPKWYVHRNCGGVTGMPEEIIRSYLADPFLYAETSFCAGCNAYVPTHELYWQQTNESLLAESSRRKAEFVQRNRLNPADFEWNEYGPIRRRNQGGGWGLTLAILGVGGAVAVMVLGGVFVLGFVALRGQANPARQVAPGPLRAGPAFKHEFPRIEIPKGPDARDIMREHNARMEKALRRQEEFLQRMRPEPLAPPEPILPPEFGAPEFGPPNGNSSLEHARKRSEESRQRAQQKMDAMRIRIRSDGS